MHTWHFSEHLLAEAAVHILALIYVSEQLDAAANYFFALWKQEDADDPEPEPGGKQPRSMPTSSPPMPRPGVAFVMGLVSNPRLWSRPITLAGSCGTARR